MLLCLNPFSDVALYTDVHACYHHANRVFTEDEKNIPHIFGMARLLRQRLCVHNANQTCVFLGESGAGKTYNAERLISQLARPHPESW